MLLSDLIEDLNKVLKEKGDKEICVWVENPDGELFLSKVPKLDIVTINCEKYNIFKTECDEQDEVLAITNIIELSEDDCIQDLDLEEEVTKWVKKC